MQKHTIPTEITPNAETIEAIKEMEQMKSDPSLGKIYTDVDQMMEELLSDTQRR